MLTLKQMLRADRYVTTYTKPPTGRCPPEIEELMAIALEAAERRERERAPREEQG